MRLEDLHGRQLGRYSIAELIGRGGMAAVYRAQDTVLRRDVAIKVLYPHHGHDQSLLERFKREAIMAAQLDHSNIVPVYDVGEQDGFVYIAMRLLRGRSLADLLHTTPQLAPAQLLPIIEPVAAALDYAHARGIVHRDIKAGNILLEDSERVLLADFGIAKSLDAPGLTSTGVLIGTPDYMAPEQIAGGTVDGRTDIYALGVLVFRCLTGRLPFEGTTEQVLLGHLHGTIPDASMLEPRLPVAVDAVLQQAMNRQPSQRYATAGAFVAALRGALRADAPTPVGTVRHPGANTAAPTLAAAPAVQRRSGSTPTQGGTVQPAARRPAPTPPPMSQPVRLAGWQVIVLVALVVAGSGLLLVNAFGARGSGAVVGIVATSTAPAATGFVPSPLPTSQAGEVIASTTPVLATSPVPSNTVAPAATLPASTSAPTAAAPTAAPAQPSATPKPAASATARPSATTTPTSAPTSAPTAAPSATPPPTAAPTAVPTVAATSVPPTATVPPAACPIPVLNGFGALLDQRLAVAQQLGCATAPESGGDVSEQAFQRGSMLWFKATNTIYALVGNAPAGTHSDFPPAQQNGQDSPPSNTPPDGLQVPASGFGLVWSTHTTVREQLGYATQAETGPFDGAFQSFEGGVMLFSPNGLGQGATIYVLYPSGRLERYADPTR